MPAQLHVSTQKKHKPSRASTSAIATSAKRHGLHIARRFTNSHQDPLTSVGWVRRDARIFASKGRVVFEQQNIEVPQSWSQTATNIVAQLYLRDASNRTPREHSAKQMISRVVNTIMQWGLSDGYFASESDALAFRDELAHLIVHQRMAFNSPVWFNVGVHERPQCSACFINSVDDSLESILELVRTEGMLFKQGSGTGTNLSALRSSREPLQGGGTASGPLSFMRGYDAFAGAIKAGGKTRRAAKMVILNVDHPDIIDFIESKRLEELKARALMSAGYDAGFCVPGGAYDSVAFQNQNHSVRVCDNFMRAVSDNRTWTTNAVKGRQPVETHQARDVWRKIAYAAYTCGDPGLQFDTTINRWNTCPNSGRIEASNPCAEFVFLNDTACNLASLNLLAFLKPDAELDVYALSHAVDITLLAQEILVSNAHYPREAIRDNCELFRPLGLGFANLGALLMSRGLAYDSDEARAYAGAISALIGGRSYAMSARIAAHSQGSFEAYDDNSDALLNVVSAHRKNLSEIDPAVVPLPLLREAHLAWDRALVDGTTHGFRNAQVTALAPTGTIALMMDCDTTGIEPDIALIKYKQLAGGGTIKIVNHAFERGLQQLGYDPKAIANIHGHVLAHESIEGARDLRSEHLSVFDCALRSKASTRSIHYMGHLKMMAACQPFISGAISKTVNLPSEASVETIEQVFHSAWSMGLKSITVYRDASKGTQPVATCGTAGECEAVVHALQK